jgi:hypothetical protein
MKMTTLFYAGMSLSATSAFAEFSIADLKKAANVAVDGFQTEYPEHVQHFTGFAVEKAGEDAKVTVKIRHHNADETFAYVCLKTATDIECRAEEF